MYEFRPMAAADLPLIRRWLAMPHVRKWWGEPDEQFDLVSGHLTHPTMDQYVVATQDRPFGYIQCYRMTEWNTGFGPQPDGTRGIDQMIGEPDMVERSHGTAFIRSFVEALLGDGVPRIIADPAPANARAIRCYEKAGFARDRLIDTPDGVALLMIRNASAS